MRDLETAARNLAVALSEFQRAVNEEYRLVSKTLTANGDLFPARNAQIAVQDSLKRITSSGTFSSMQAAGINAAWRAWQPLQKARKLTYTKMGVGRNA